MENSFSVGGKNFKLRKLNAFKQFHVVRKIGPILSEVLPALSGVSVKQVENLSQEEQLDYAAKFAGPVFAGLSKLSDKDADYVLYSLLQAVEMQQETGNYARICTDDNILMFDDFQLPTLLQLAGKAFAYNLTGFFDALPRLK